MPPVLSKSNQELLVKVAEMRTKLIGVPPSKHLGMLKAWFGELPPDQLVLAQQLYLLHEDVMPNAQKKPSTLVAPPGGWLTIAGALLAVTIFVAAIAIPSPTPFQFFVFRILMALAAASIVGALGGLIKVQGKLWGFAIKAGGAAATFVLVYAINPPALIEEKASAEPAKQAPPRSSVELSTGAQPPRASD